MYRKMQRLESPILMVIQDTNNNVSEEDASFRLTKTPASVSKGFLKAHCFHIFVNWVLCLFQVFGALTSCALKVSDHFYGTGESLLFRFNPQFQVYNWTGDNMYFIKGNNESLAIGAGE